MAITTSCLHSLSLGIFDKVDYVAMFLPAATKKLLQDLSKVCIGDACTCVRTNGELAQVVERSLSMREVPGSMPGFSKLYIPFFFFFSPPPLLLINTYIWTVSAKMSQFYNSIML